MTAGCISPHARTRYDVIDLSLADSVGLSNPGGFAIVEKYRLHARGDGELHAGAEADGGILSVTLWNKEEPPKSVLKLYATMAEAARDVDGGGIAESTSSSPRAISRPRPCSTSAAASRRRRSRSCASTPSAMSFDEIYYPGIEFDTADRAADPRRLSRLVLLAGDAADPTAPPAKEPGRQAAARAPPAPSRRRRPTTAAVRARCRRPRSAGSAWHYLVMAAGRRSPATMSSTPARSPTTGPISPPM